MYFPRQEAFKRAVISAKAKAECVTQTVGVQLGPALQVVELTQESADAPTAKERTKLDTTDQSPASLHQKHLNASLAFTSRVYICFETQPVRVCSHRKCTKH